MGMSSWGCRPGPEDSRGLSGRHDVGEWQCGGGKAVQGAPRPPPRGPGTPARGASTMGVKGGLCGRPGGRAPSSNEGAPAAGTSEGCAGAAVGPAVVDSEGGGGPAVTDGGSCGSSGSGLNDGGGGGWGNATDPGWFYHVLGAAALPLGNPWDDRSKRGGACLAECPGGPTHGCTGARWMRRSHRKWLHCSLARALSESWGPGVSGRPLKRGKNVCASPLEVCCS